MHNIKNIVKDSFINDEITKVKIKEEVVSVYTLFQQEKLKNKRFKQHTDNLLEDFQLEFGSIEHIYFNSSNIGLQIFFDSDKKLKLEYLKTGEISLLESDLSYKEQKSIVDNYSKDLFNLIDYGVECDYHIVRDMETISNTYKIELRPYGFNISLLNDILNSEKTFQLYYSYDQKLFVNAVNTELGIFNIQTNINGMNKMINHYASEEGKMSLFLKNLKVYKSDVFDHKKSKQKILNHE